MGWTSGRVQGLKRKCLGIRDYTIRKGIDQSDAHIGLV